MAEELNRWVCDDCGCEFTADSGVVLCPKCRSIFTSSLSQGVTVDNTSRRLNICEYCHSLLTKGGGKQRLDNNGVLCDVYECVCGRTSVMLPCVDESGQVYMED